ncbi:hypothetical protein DPMN_054884 [Dreissena polymorpha]|uniref:Secreted protein n=1 Tax=Dreissena polymorpha TaxID=45954 RepID=A0A9D4HRW7_DREPO|nr:hypothetical protein DPMN_054746 [Dreissena polymorpha]KAH3728921.1 hypothetical protein DPMN_054884 [Dreissena polymorpha]
MNMLASLAFLTAVFTTSMPSMKSPRPSETISSSWDVSGLPIDPCCFCLASSISLVACFKN